MEIAAVAIRVGRPNEFTLVVSEVEAVFPKGGFDLVGNFDEGGAVYFVT